MFVSPYIFFTQELPRKLFLFFQPLCEGGHFAHVQNGFKVYLKFKLLSHNKKIILSSRMEDNYW